MYVWFLKKIFISGIKNTDELYIHFELPRTNTMQFLAKVWSPMLYISVQNNIRNAYFTNTKRYINSSDNCGCLLKTKLNVLS